MTHNFNRLIEQIKTCRDCRELFGFEPNPVFYNPDNFYITAIGHCYPGRNPNGGDNAPPKHCADKWLWQEIKYVNRKIIILIGKYAAQYFFPKRDFSDLIFNNQMINEKLTHVLPHPSPINRKWFKDHPEFDLKRLAEIRQIVRKVLP